MFRKIAFALGLAVASTAAHAGTLTTFSDRTTFEAGFSSVIVEDFGTTAHFPISSGVLNASTNEAGILPGDIVSGVTFSTQVGTGNFFNIDCCFPSGGTAFLDSVTGNNNLTVTFDTAQAGFGFDTNASWMSAFDMTVNFLSGFSVSNSYAPGSGFFGISSSATDIVSVVIDGTAGGLPFALDNFTFTDQPTSTPAVPLPGGLPLLAGGLTLLGLSRRLRTSR